MMDALFGEVRGVLARPTFAWGDLVEVLQGYEESQRVEFLEGMFPYLERALQVIPSQERVLPEAWAERLAETGRFALCRLVHVFAVPTPSPSAGSLEAMLCGGELAELRVLELSSLMNVSLSFLERMVVPKLEVLRLNDLALSRSAADGLMSNQGVGKVRELGMGWVGLGNHGAASLLLAPWWGDVEVLDLEGNSIDDPEVVDALLTDPGLHALRVLSLGWNDVGEVGARALAAAPYLSNLEILGLENNALETKTTAHMVQRIRGTSMRELRLYHGALGEPVAHAIAQNPALSGLTVLDLDETEIGDRGASILLASRHLPAEVLERVRGWTPYPHDD